MRRTRQLLQMGIVSAALFMLAGCHGMGSKTRVYVNQKNSAQELMLVEQTTLKSYAIQTFHGGPVRGTYTLVTEAGKETGSFSSSKSGYKLQSSAGKSWTIDLKSDGTFDDQRGTWKQKQYTVEKKLAKELNAVFASKEGTAQ